MKSKGNITAIRPAISQLTREELELMLKNDFGDEERKQIEAQAKSNGMRTSDVVFNLIKLGDPDQSNPDLLSQEFLRSRMNNAFESIPRFCLGN